MPESKRAIGADDVRLTAVVTGGDAGAGCYLRKCRVDSTVDSAVRAHTHPAWE